MPLDDLASILSAAWARRSHLHADPATDAYRILHGFGEGVPGLNIDRLGEVALLQLEPELESRVGAVIEALDACWKAPSVIVRVSGRTRPDGSPVVRVARGDVRTAFEVREGGLLYRVDPLHKPNHGLFLDARPARAWIRRNSEGRRILNLFAFTGSLGLSAAAGGARRVTHLEMQEGHLRRIRDNYALNGLAIDGRELVGGDLYQHLRRAGRAGQSFEGIILDPPPAMPSRRGRRPKGQDLPRLVRMASRLLAPGGWLLCLVHRTSPGARIEPQAIATASAHPLYTAWEGSAGEDFPEPRGAPRLRVVALERSGGDTAETK